MHESGEEQWERAEQTLSWAWSQDLEITTWAKVKNQLLNGLNHPGALIISAL